MKISPTHITDRSRESTRIMEKDEKADCATVGAICLLFIFYFILILAHFGIEIRIKNLGLQSSNTAKLP